MNIEKKWYVVYSKPRWEKKLYAKLLEAGIEAYCPLNKVKKKWSDRMKTVEVPLFTSYVFVKILENQKSKVRETPGVVNFVYEEGKPAVIREKEIEKIQRFLEEYQNVEVVPSEFHKGQIVKVNEGLFVDEEGKVIDTHNNKVRVVIKSLGYDLVAEFDKSKLSIGK
ncbi:MAG: antitermination protein NusG [Sphingobacteriales bacterium 41-5]|nr:MAG: antitermination protein NusG [Sphingobacteriales bacterium 41-5]